MARHYNHHYHHYHNRNFNHHHYHNKHPILSALGALFVGLMLTVIGYVVYLRYAGLV